METKKRKKYVDTSTTYNNKVMYNDKYGKPMDSAAQGLTSNPANDKITRDRRNYSGHNLSKNDMDIEKMKKEVDT